VDRRKKSNVVILGSYQSGWSWLCSLGLECERVGEEAMHGDDGRCRGME